MKGRAYIICIDYIILYKGRKHPQILVWGRSWNRYFAYVYLHAWSHFSNVQLFSTLWSVASQAPLFLGFSRQEYWGGLAFLPPGDLPDSGIKLVPLPSPALAGRFFTSSAIGKPNTWHILRDNCNLKTWKYDKRGYSKRREQLGCTKASSLQQCQCHHRPSTGFSSFR